MLTSLMAACMALTGLAIAFATSQIYMHGFARAGMAIQAVFMLEQVRAVRFQNQWTMEGMKCKQVGRDLLPKHTLLYTHQHGICWV